MKYFRLILLLHPFLQLKYISLGYILPRKSSFLIKSLEKDFLNVFNNIKSNKKDVINVINKYLPSFDHIEKGKHLDQRM